METDSAHGNGVLKQWVRERPGANSWGGPKPSNPPPLTLIGDVGWQAYETCIDAGMDGCIGSDNASGCFVMLCAHATSESPWSGWPPSALCLQIGKMGPGRVSQPATGILAVCVWALHAIDVQPALHFVHRLWQCDRQHRRRVGPRAGFPTPLECRRGCHRPGSTWKRLAYGSL